MPGRTPPTLGDDGSVSWGYASSDLRVSVSEQNGRLDTQLDSPTNRILTLPATATESRTRSIEFPNGEGQSIPVDDPFWWSDEPSMLSLDHRLLDEHGRQIADMQAFFTVLQDAAGTDAMTSFERISPEVQRTTFGDDAASPSLTVTVNYGETDSSTAPAGCAVATVTGQTPITYCPEHDPAKTPDQKS